MEEHGEQISLSIVQSDDKVHEVKFSHLTSSKETIFRIPGLFKMRNEQVYTPYKFSIGPWHFGETPMLRTGQKLKESLFERLISHFRDPEEKERELKEVIERVHVRARACYEGGDVYDGGKTMDLAKEEFEKILLVDGCFIIELFGMEGHLFSLSGADYQVFYHDLLLLDNQIPWFVLEDLFAKTCNRPEGRNQSLVEMAIEFFRPVISCYELRESLSLQSSHDKIIHLVDFVWRFWVASSVSERTAFEFGALDCRILIPSATRLKEAGVKLQKANSKKISYVRFNKDKGVLEIPPLQIAPWTETLFRNLVIFEQYILDFPRVTSYAILLDCLVDTSDDVDLMSRAGILDNKLNPEETVNFLNRVRDNTIIFEFSHAQLCKDVNSYCERRWPRWRASLIHNYCTKPWAIVSVVFATIVLFFTIMQVFYQ